MAFQLSTLTPYTGVGQIDLSTTSDSSGSLFASGNALITSAKIERKLNQWKVASMIIECLTPDWYQQVFLPIRLKNIPLYFRMGIRSGDASAYYTDWEPHVIVSSQQITGSSLGNTPTKVLVTTADMLFYLNVGDQVVVRKGSISDIVSTIASSKNVPVEVEDTVDSKFTLYQTYQSDYEFILRRLLPRAVNQMGFGNYSFYIDGGTLIFYTLDYQTPVATQVDFTDTISPACASDLVFHDKTWLKIAEGSAYTAATLGNAYTSGQVPFYASNSAASLNFATSSLNPQPAAHFTRLLARHLGDNPVEEVAAQAQNMYASNRSEQFAATFKVVSNPFLSLTDIVTFKTSQPFDYAGAYSVSTCTHTFDRGVFTSEYTVIRDSTEGQGAGATSANPSLAGGSTASDNPFGSGSSASAGSAPRVGQTTTLSTASGNYVTVPVLLPT